MLASRDLKRFRVWGLGFLTWSLNCSGLQDSKIGSQTQKQHANKSIHGVLWVDLLGFGYGVALCCWCLVGLAGTEGD